MGVYELEINFVSEEYKESIKHIFTYCFNIPPENGEDFANKVFSPENCLDGRLGTMEPLTVALREGTAAVETIENAPDIKML